MTDEMYLGYRWIKEAKLEEQKEEKREKEEEGRDRYRPKRRGNNSGEIKSGGIDFRQLKVQQVLDSLMLVLSFSYSFFFMWCRVW